MHNLINKWNYVEHGWIFAHFGWIIGQIGWIPAHFGWIIGQIGWIIDQTGWIIYHFRCITEDYRSSRLDSAPILLSDRLNLLVYLSFYRNEFIKRSNPLFYLLNFTK
ncbi:hypothetical protein [Rossellomorea sp. NRS-1567]|uniref:hypothetical protein n=1 Tax=Rossellomorea sp. NRS-1567 TaxID=3233901 RepID=UPI003D29D0A4